MHIPEARRSAQRPDAHSGLAPSLLPFTRAACSASSAHIPGHEKATFLPEL